MERMDENDDSVTALPPFSEESFEEAFWTVKDLDHLERKQDIVLENKKNISYQK